MTFSKDALAKPVDNGELVEQQQELIPPAPVQEIQVEESHTGTRKGTCLGKNGRVYYVQTLPRLNKSSMWFDCLLSNISKSSLSLDLLSLFVH